MLDNLTVSFGRALYTLFLFLAMLIPGKCHRWGVNRFHSE